MPSASPFGKPEQEVDPFGWHVIDQFQQLVLGSGPLGDVPGLVVENLVVIDRIGGKNPQKLVPLRPSILPPLIWAIYGLDLPI